MFIQYKYSSLEFGGTSTVLTLHKHRTSAALYYTVLYSTSTVGYCIIVINVLRVLYSVLAAESLLAREGYLYSTSTLFMYGTVQ